MADKTFVPAEHGGGEQRKLDPLSLTLAHPKKVTAIFNVVPLVDPQNYRTHDLAAFCPPIGDQDGVGLCNACTTTETVMTLRAREGLPYVPLSPATIYSLINGGRDDGSLPEDALAAAMATGIGTIADVKYTDWRGAARSSAWKTAAANYKLLDAYYLTSVEQAIAAIFNDRPVNVCMAWYDGDNPDKNGILPLKPSGGAGGHSILGRGVYFKDVLQAVGPDAPMQTYWDYEAAHKPSTDVGNLLIRIQNHWTVTWGIQGTAFIPLARIVDNFSDFKMFAAWSTIQESSNTPAPIAA